MTKKKKLTEKEKKAGVTPRYKRMQEKRQKLLSDTGGPRKTDRQVKKADKLQDKAAKLRQRKLKKKK
tara:strand:+ start:633 stop:833 length:201 start_codon:yes stop_codon:yes gene_type:complete